MKMIAIETTGSGSSVAAANAGEVAATLSLDADLRTVQSLVPTIHKLLRDLGWRPAELRLVAVAAGPGSFTGLRIGVATAKTLAYATGAECLAINTLETIAHRAASDPAWSGGARLHVAIEAYRQRVHAATFRRHQGWPAWKSETEMLDHATWLSRLAAGDIVSGTAVGKLGDQIPSNIARTDPALWRPTADEVARVAWRRYVAGERHDMWRLAPFYFGASAAEEKWAERDSAAQTE